MMNPPNAKRAKSANVPKVLAIIMFLPAAAVNRSSADSIWLISISRRYFLKSLHEVDWLVIPVRSQKIPFASFQ